MPVHDIRWDLSSIYLSPDSPDYLNDKKELKRLSQDFVDQLADGANLSPGANIESETASISNRLVEFLNRLDRLSGLEENLGSYIYALWSVDTANEDIQAEKDELDEISLILQDARIRFRALLPMFADIWPLLFNDERLIPFRYYLDEQFQLAAKQMSVAEESLAADLQRSGADAWSRLQGRLSSQLACTWDKGTKTVTELRSMAHHPDRDIRRRAWLAETALWKESEISFAAALNGVKGCSTVLNQRRAWGSTLERSLFQNRLSRAALDAMLGVMTESLPAFRRYFRAKSGYLGLKKLSWYDLFAPIGSTKVKWTWDRVCDAIPGFFDTLSSEMGDFARFAFERNWIDGSSRRGKLGGAYCIHLPLSGESRILCNFEESFDSLSTVAHELGHAWHGEQMKNLPVLNREYPMTLAETASIFSETLVFHSAMEQSPDSEKPSLLDSYLMGASQVVVDILSRFQFESAVMRARPKGELSPRELSDMMLYSQQRCYGDALLETERHPWMWAVKSHYYSANLAFYNFPYAFGQLFSLGLFSRFRREGPGFASTYNKLLSQTGSDSAVGVARSAGFDIESPDFWRQGIGEITELIDTYEMLS